LKTIACMIQKGGVGKSSISASLAAELAQTGNVLFIDADPQSNSSTWLGPEELSLELSDVLYGKAELERAILKTGTPGLNLLPSAGLSGELNLYAKTKAVEDQKCFRRLVKAAAALGYRHIVFDTSPGFSSLERAVFMAADELVVPLEADSFAMDGLQIFSEHLKQFREYEEQDKPHFNKIVVNKIDKRIAQHEEILEQIRAYSGTFEIYEIPVDQAFKKCQRARLTIQEWTGTKADTLAAIKKLAADIREA